MSITNGCTAYPYLPFLSTKKINPFINVLLTQEIRVPQKETEKKAVPFLRCRHCDLCPILDMMHLWSEYYLATALLLNSKNRTILMSCIHILGGLRTRGPGSAEITSRLRVPLCLRWGERKSLKGLPHVARLTPPPPQRGHLPNCT